MHWTSCGAEAVRSLRLPLALAEQPSRAGRRCAFLMHDKFEARYSAVTVEVFRRGERAHRAHLEWTPTRMAHGAGSIGPKTRELVEAILADRPHPETGCRSCLGILRLAKRYGNERPASPPRRW